MKLETLVPLVSLVSPELMVLTDATVTQEPRELRVNVVPPENLDKMAVMVLLENLVLLDLRDPRDLRENRELLESLVPTVSNKPYCKI